MERITVLVSRLHSQVHYTGVQFGDGITGSRLPTGTDNVQALYRKGMGEAGLM